ncbi:HAMP domain-containing protein [Rhizobium sp. 16-449-1b]|uniref:methyl-accepting chemotaxis protein n=1 Tax=Rhizobium sp. 16-449-1b TaxID=2819989 RepID=UPI001ADD56C8|nr:methyl-accepting chemotaxis protein [Rhizobium sp. 16-449-1b]MBO9197593.1 HAMP domain-containing protein [Rhizobium sp. 16-449-1b]
MLKNLKIKTKFLMAIAMLGLVSMAGLLYLTDKFSAANQQYTGFLQNESQAATFSARAAAGIWTSTTWLSRAVAQQPGSPAFDNISKRFATEFDGARKRLAQVSELVPSRKSAIDELLAGADGLKSLGDQLLAAHAAGNAEQTQQLSTKLDDTIIGLSPKFGANNKAMADLLEQGGSQLSASVSSTIFYTLVGITFGVIAAIAFAMVIAQKGVTTPMAKLRERMETLASGETGKEVDGLDRRDEIGQMAAAVAVFRTNAIDRMRIEQQAEATRSMSESERLEREAEKANEAANLQRAVKALGGALGNLADGDLNCRIDMPFTGDLDMLRQDFNAAISKLNNALQAVGANASAISAGSSQIRASADDLSKRTEQQAASVEETAAALEQITTTVKDAAGRASDASQLVAKTREAAERSGEVVRNAVTAMHLIEQSSNEISNIIGVIDDIAFQTNLLALNAGVEAARAGEAGKGFAVVAQEVRELAQRSARAAKEIKALITASGSQVESGVELVGEAGKALDAIVAEVQEINRHVHAIAEASREQSLGLQEINTAVNTMDEGTQKNAAMVEETTAASHSLAHEAMALSQLMAQFKLDGGAVANQGRPSFAKPAATTASHGPVASPARQLGQKLTNAFRGNAALKQEPEWSEF